MEIDGEFKITAGKGLILIDISLARSIEIALRDSIERLNGSGINLMQHCLSKLVKQLKESNVE